MLIKAFEEGESYEVVFENSRIAPVHQYVVIGNRPQEDIDHGYVLIHGFIDGYFETEVIKHPDFGEERVIFDTEWGKACIRAFRTTHKYILELGHDEMVALAHVLAFRADLKELYDKIVGKIDKREENKNEIRRDQ